jgi:hypothetical protein
MTFENTLSINIFQARILWLISGQRVTIGSRDSSNLKKSLDHVAFTGLDSKTGCFNDSRS